MYRKPRFLKVLHAIREQMSREVDYDVDLFVEVIRAGEQPVVTGSLGNVRAFRKGKDIAAKVTGEAVIRVGKGRRRAVR
ncbi:MAG: hypothetical protein QOD75_3190 [Blastocatellia bacterium]|jgi:hypothetical protein|nr:hypothetical protein [Blastocatellia bacterium]